MKFKHREDGIYRKWENTNPSVPVNDHHYSFDTPERQEAFVRAQFTTDQLLERYKRYREEWYRRPKEFDAGDFPLAVGIELVSTCNLACNMCYTITDRFQDSVVGKQRMLPWEVVTRIVDECAAIGVESILFSWRGESTLYRSRFQGKEYRFSDALKYAVDKGILEVSSLTNGQLIDEEMAKAIVDAQPNWINFSIDGLGVVYNKIRTPKGKEKTDYDAFAVVVENIKRLVRVRDGKGKTKPQLRSNTVFPSIANDVEAYYDFMKSIGIGWITANEILDFRGSDADNEELPPDVVKKDWICQYPFQRLMISANGVIVPCTGAHSEEPSLVLGRYKGTAEKVVRNSEGKEITVDNPELTIQDAWQCEKLRKIRDIHRSGKRTVMRGCRNCRHGAVKYGIQWLPSDWDMEKMQWMGRSFRNG